MTIEGIMAIVLAMTAMIGVYYLILYFKIDRIGDEVNEIKRKMDEEEENSVRKRLQEEKSNE